MKASSEEPWYTPAIIAFLSDDVPRVLGLDSKLFARDIATLVHRLATEGESFLTKTLPKFGKAIDLSLQGHTPLATPHFRKRGRSALPAFLSVLLRRVYKDDGWVRDEPCITSIRLLRQVCLWCKKIKKGYSDESLRKAIVEFKEIDEALPSKMSDLDVSASLLGTAKALVNRIFRNIGDIEDHCPKHGPGAVAGGEGVIGKRALGVKYIDLECVFPAIPWFRSPRDVVENVYEFCLRVDRAQRFGISRTEFVNKDSEGPRTIGLEEAEYAYIQQAVKDWLYTHLEQRPNLARGRINFTDQSKNRELARLWDEIETLDLSKASDREAYVVVEYLFNETRLWPYLRACRSPGTMLPGGELLWFKKFAPMGSAVCFPVMAVVIWTLTVAALHRAGMPLFLACRKTYIYGDDLIVPRGFYEHIRTALHSVGLRLNEAKCCIHGKFRESCGLDAYDGQDVSPVRMKIVDVHGAPDLVSLVKHQNSLAKAGYWSASSAYREAINGALARIRRPSFRKTVRTVYRSLPYGDSDVLPILCWHAMPEFHNYRVIEKDSIAWVRGWVFSPDLVRADDALEARYLRESLCHGGPVGVMKKASLEEAKERYPLPGPVRSRGLVSRFLSERYRGQLVKKELSVFVDSERKAVSAATGDSAQAELPDWI